VKVRILHAEPKEAFPIGTSMRGAKLPSQTNQEWRSYEERLSGVPPENGSMERL